jgi:predicted permease
VLNRLRLRLRALLFRRRLEREMNEELGEHLARATAHLMAHGMTRPQAEREARREFGNLDLIRDQGRDARGGRAVESLVADLRFGLRQWRRQPGTTITMIVVLALGLGFNTAIFLLISALATGVSPGVTPDSSLVRIRGGVQSATFGRTIGREFSYPEYREYAAESRLFRAVAGWASSDVTLGLGGDQGLQSGAATYVTSSYFGVLGVRPIIGGGWPVDARDDGPPVLVAVISHAVWDRYFGRAEDVVGRTLEINDVPVTIIGVAPRRFNGARTGGSQTRVWLPLNARATVQRGEVLSLGDADAAIFGLVARLQDGVKVEDTQPVVRAIAERTARGPSGGALSTDVVVLTADNYFPPSGLESDEAGPRAGRLVVLLIPLLILSITGTTVSSLQAGLAVARRREIAVRLALGASRRRLVRQLVTENVMVALSAAMLGLFVIWVLLRIFDSTIPDVQIRIEWSAVTFAGALALVTGVLVGLSPALHATRLALADVLRGAAGVIVPARSRLQASLVVAQIALTQPALFMMGALLLEMVSGLNQLHRTRHSDSIVEARFNTNPRYGRIDDAREQALARVAVRFASLSGVAGVVAQEDRDDYLHISADPSDPALTDSRVPNLEVRVRAAPPGYFAVMGTPIVRGRDFDRATARDEGDIVIDAALARRMWGDADPIGQRLTGTAGPTRRSNVLTVIGVVDDAGAAGSDSRAPRIFVPNVNVTGRFLIRTHGPAQPLIQSIRAAAADEVPDLPLVSATTLAAIEAGERRNFTRAIAAAGTGGLVALFLSAVGLYAVVAFAVSQRVREIGIRAALGADRRRLIGTFLGRGLALSTAGMVVGLALSVVSARILASLEGKTLTPGTWAIASIVAAVVIGVTLLATWIPSRRAATVDPLQALRLE